MVTIRIPAPPRGLPSNLLGLLGLVGMVVAVGGLTGTWWWSMLTGGAVAVGLSYMAHVNSSSVEPGEAAESVRQSRLA